QAEDGIRDRNVTGLQTCALPISYLFIRISSPRIENPCLYGIDMSTKESLIAANYTNEEICEIIGADSIAFLSVEGLERAIVKDHTINQGICAACMTGNYPVLENDSRKEF